MWVITEDGFYSAVAHDTDPSLVVVRTRVKADAEFLREVVRDLDETDAQILTYLDTDYPWRLIMPKRAWVLYLAEASCEIDYPNFKDRVSEVQGPLRAQTYGKVWGVLYGLEAQDPDRMPYDQRWSAEPTDGWATL